VALAASILGKSCLGVSLAISPEASPQEHVLLAEATAIEVDSRRVLLDSDSVSYDSLIVATGSGHHYFGNDHWEALAPGLKTVKDATEIRCLEDGAQGCCDIARGEPAG
jgi:NADH dehydrogenase